MIKRIFWVTALGLTCMTATAEQWKSVGGHLLTSWTSEVETNDADGFRDAGSNNLALHCCQTEGGQGVDVSLIKLKQSD